MPKTKAKIPNKDRGRLVSRCLGDMEFYPGEPRKRCTGVIWEDGSVTGSCGDPCSFIMRKGGSGDPPLLSPEDFMRELRFLQKRCERWAG